MLFTPAAACFNSVQGVGAQRFSFQCLSDTERDTALPPRLVTAGNPDVTPLCDTSAC